MPIRSTSGSRFDNDGSRWNSTSSIDCTRRCSERTLPCAPKVPNTGPNTPKTQYIRCRFGKRVIPGLSMVVPSRTRRALSIALVDVQNRPSLVSQKCRIPSPISQKPGIENTDSVNKWFQVCQWWFQVELDELCRLHRLILKKDP